MTTSVSDSYIATIEDADTYFSARLGTSVWDAASSADKAKALKMATAKIDSLNYSGYKYLSTQDRQFPRKYVINPNTDSPWGLNISIDSYGYAYESEVPDEIEAACCLEALALLTDYSSSDPISERDLQEKGVASFSLGRLSMTFVGGSSDRFAGMRSKEAYQLISPYIESSPLLI